MPRTRTRASVTGGYVCMRTQSSTNAPNRHVNTEKCVDETHPGPPYRSGGPFTVTRRKHRHGYSGSVACSNFNHSEWYSGSFWVEPVDQPLTPTPALTASELLGWGSKGYNRALPVHDKLSLGQAVIEARDFGQMIRSTEGFFRNFSSSAFSGKSAQFWSEAWLNASFGWKPFLNDLYGAFNLYNKLNDQFRWLKANQGRLIKRRFTLLDSNKDTLQEGYNTIASLQPVLDTKYYDFSGTKYGRVETWRHERTKVWFVGAFTFHVPGIDKMQAPDWRLAAGILGATPDLNLLWKVTPWSWLFDWFTSVGSSASTLSLTQRYGQVAKYAYIMGHKSVTWDTYAYQYVKTGNIAKPSLTLVQARSRTEYETKQRAVANPYGFGITWDSLTPFQLSILAALGLSRGHSGS